MKQRRLLISSLVLMIIMGLSACSSHLPFAKQQPAPIVDSQGKSATRIVHHPENVSPNFAPGQKGSFILSIAQSQLGTPYRYGGVSPDGFDCSGLVQFTFKRAGIAVPRTAQAQFKAAKPITKKELRPGDVIFFKHNFRRISHVGIYAGKGKFIHAPTAGKHVEYTQLNDPYWSKRIARAGRFY